MINKLEISNFKLHDHTKIEVGGLTIFTGMNGMGKSSIIQSLLLLRQSFFMNDLEAIIYSILSILPYFYISYKNAGYQ